MMTVTTKTTVQFDHEKDDLASYDVQDVANAMLDHGNIADPEDVTSLATHIGPTRGTVYSKSKEKDENGVPLLDITWDNDDTGREAGWITINPDKIPDAMVLAAYEYIRENRDYSREVMTQASL